MVSHNKVSTADERQSLLGHRHGSDDSRRNKPPLSRLLGLAGYGLGVVVVAAGVAAAVCVGTFPTSPGSSTAVPSDQGVENIRRFDGISEEPGVDVRLFDPEQHTLEPSEGDFLLDEEETETLSDKFSNKDPSDPSAMVDREMGAKELLPEFDDKAKYHNRNDPYMYEQRSEKYMKDMSTNGGHSTCGTCSLVFPAPGLKGQGLGKVIDSADCVVRYNHHDPELVPAEDYGKRDDIRVFNKVDMKVIEDLRWSKCLKDGKCKRVAMMYPFGDKPIRFKTEGDSKKYLNKLALKKFMDENPNIEVIQSWMWFKVIYEFSHGQSKFRYIDENSEETKARTAAQVFTNGTFTPSIGFVCHFWLYYAGVCDKMKVYGIPKVEASTDFDREKYGEVDTTKQMGVCHDMAAEHRFLKNRTAAPTADIYTRIELVYTPGEADVEAQPNVEEKDLSAA